jgi:hypothetical protein
LLPWRVLCFAVPAVALPLLATPDFFPWSIEQDRIAGAPDFSHLNEPISGQDRVFVRDGHFFRVGADLEPNTEDDGRVHFWGVNLAFSANFPSSEDAPRIARRLRRLGVNIVRLHHMDSSPDALAASASSLLTQDPYPTLNPYSVERLRMFINALKAEGIYINLNLHVGYTFRSSIDSVPTVPDFPSQSKPLHILHPRLVELQTEFARKVLTALELADDPALAMVEINNESSLSDSWQRGALSRYLQGEYGEVFRSRWNEFLLARYQSNNALRVAWTNGDADGPNLLPDRWVVENHTRGEVRLETQPASDPTTIRVEASMGGAPVIIKQVGFSVTTERPYIAEIELRADLPGGATRNVYWDIKQDTSPWRTLTGRTVRVTGEWQTFRMIVTPAFELDQVGRFAVSIENVGAPVYIRNGRFYRAGQRGLADGESLDSGNVSLVSDEEAPVLERLNDYLTFIAQQDRAYLSAMLGAVREIASPLVPVAGTQLGFGGLLNYDSHEDLDYHDHHFYVDHYNFPNVAWDSRDWRIRDTSSTGGGLSQFLSMAAARPAGRPYTVSEFNQNWPNTYAAEIDPTLAVFARFQDWDGVMHFAWAHSRGWDDNVPKGFDLNGDWTKWPGFGQAAWLFRSGVIAAGVAPVEISVSGAMRLQATRERRNGNITAFLTASAGFDPNLALVHPVRLAMDSTAEVRPEAPAPVSPLQADTGEFSFDQTNRLFLVHAARAAGIFGFAGQKTISAGAIDVRLSEGARGFAALLATALDGQALGDAGRVLVSNPGYTLRTHPGSTPPRPQQLVNYPGTTDWWTIESDPAYPTRPSGSRDGGTGPTWMERVEAHITVRSAAASLTVYTLDGTGARSSELGPAFVERVEGGYRVHLQAEGQLLTPWFEFVFE